MTHKPRSIFYRSNCKISQKMWIIISLIIIIVFFFTIFLIIFAQRGRQNDADLKKIRLYDLWEEEDYEQVYAISSRILQIHPLQNTALVFKGYSAYYLSIAQSDTSLAQTYLDESINSLRITLQNTKSSLKNQIKYVLGKAYFQKNQLAGYYYYADLAIHYLDDAFISGYSAVDMAEYRGLSYASLGMIEESISAFSEALIQNPTDMLLAAIGEQYYKLADYVHAKQYLFRVIQESMDDDLVLKCRNVLGNIYVMEENYSDALEEFKIILEKKQDYADAYYGIGVIYEKQGDLVKARAEWRKALKVQVNHPYAQQKLNS